MTREELKKKIEYLLIHFIIHEDVHFLESIYSEATIVRILRLALQYSNFAQEYLDSLPKATIN